MEPKMIDEKARLKPGRPPNPDGAMQQLAIRIPNWMLDEIDVIIDSREGQTERTTVMREMIARGIRAWKDDARL
jgi:metal-responsive CopG/Arc/MetJ family transcriptional regulator